MTLSDLAYLVLVTSALSVWFGLILRWKRDRARAARVARLAARLDYVIRAPRSRIKP